MHIRPRGSSTSGSGDACLTRSIACSASSQDELDAEGTKRATTRMTRPCADVPCWKPLTSSRGSFGRSARGRSAGKTYSSPVMKSCYPSHSTTWFDPTQTRDVAGTGFAPRWFRGVMTRLRRTRGELSCSRPIARDPAPPRPRAGGHGPPHDGYHRPRGPFGQAAASGGQPGAVAAIGGGTTAHYPRQGVLRCAS
jgi:hypothetical protein